MLKDKIVFITGATDGIGKSAALLLAQNSADLIIHGKDIQKGEKTKNEIIQKTGNKKVTYLNADLTSFPDIKELSHRMNKQFPHIDILINNAGIYENKRTILKNGLEKNFMVNYLSGFYLTLQLLDLLKKSANARIINVSSMIHAGSIDFENLNAERYYSGDQAYSLSKLCNILFTYELDDLLKDENITVNALHPGVINTKLLKAGWGAIGNEVEEGAKRIFYLADSEEVKGVSGKYFMNDHPVRSAEISYNKQVRRKLWDISKSLIEQN